MDKEEKNIEKFFFAQTSTHKLLDIEKKTSS